jgi:hypothetical protein
MVFTQIGCGTKMYIFACSAALWFVTTSGANAQTTRSDSELIKEELLPALKLVVDPAVAEIIRPYADCFSTAVATSSASSLKDNQAVQLAQLLADATCRLSKEAATREADAALAIRSPSLSAQARAHLLGGVRRLATFFALAAKYRQVGRGAVLQRYLERTGREAKAGQPVVLLSGE